MKSLDEFIEEIKKEEDGCKVAMHEHGGDFLKHEWIVYSLCFGIAETVRKQSEALNAEFKRLHERLDKIEE